MTSTSPTKLKSKVSILTVGIILLLLISSIYFLGKNNKQITKKQITHIAAKPIDTRVPSVKVDTNLASKSANVNLKTFKNATFSFDYPADYVVGGSAFLFVGHDSHPNGSCILGGIQINTTGYGYTSEEIQNNLNNIHIKTIANGKLYTGMQRAGACSDITRRIAQLHYKSKKIEISLDGDDPNDMHSFNTILSTFLFAN